MTTSTIYSRRRREKHREEYNAYMRDYLREYRKTHPQKHNWPAYHAKLKEQGLTQYQARKLRKIQKIKELA